MTAGGHEHRDDHHGWPEQTSGHGAEAPGRVRAAVVLWIILGAVLVVGSLGSWLSPATRLRPSPVGSGTTDALAVVFIALGIALIIAAGRMRRGSGQARVLVTVLGAVTMTGVWPVLLVVPALILQYGGEANRWFAERAATPPDVGGDPSDAEDQPPST